MWQVEQVAVVELKTAWPRAGSPFISISLAMGGIFSAPLAVGTGRILAASVRTRSEEELWRRLAARGLASSGSFWVRARLRRASCPGRFFERAETAACRRGWSRLASAARRSRDWMTLASVEAASAAATLGAVSP